MKFQSTPQIVVLEYDPYAINSRDEEGMFKVINRATVPRSDFTLDNTVNKIVEFNQLYNPAFIYVDRGYGEEVFNHLKDKIVEMLNNNEPIYKIAIELEVNRKSLSRYIKSLGFEPNQKYVRNINPEKLRKYSLNEDIFEVIDTEEKAYWLGFLMADVHINLGNYTVDLCLQEEDENHIGKFRDFCRSNKPIYLKKKKTKDKEYLSYRICISSKKMVSDLERHGCTSKKTFALKFPEIEQNLIRHFIRGYVDGDGCIYVKGGTIEILGCEEFLIELCNRLHTKINIYGFNHSTIKRVMIFGDEAIRIANFLYNGNSICLERKHDNVRRLR